MTVRTIVFITALSVSIASLCKKEVLIIVEDFN